jgi:phosphate transport system substrate-binding protein
MVLVDFISLINLSAMFNKWTFVLVIAVLNAACNSPEKKETDQKPDTLKVASDYSLPEFLEEQKAVFEFIYPNTHIQLFKDSEAGTLKGLKARKYDMIFTAQDLDANDYGFFKSKNHTLNTSEVLNLGIILFVGSQHLRKEVKASDLKRFFESPNSEEKLIFYSSNKAIPFFVKERFALKSFPKNCSFTPDSRDFTAYLNQHQNAIGISFLPLENLKTLAIIDDLGGESTLQTPNQSTITSKEYLFVSSVKLYYHEPYQGLAHRFARFVLSEKGQKIILKQGFAPINQPTRKIQLQ